MIMCPAVDGVPQVAVGHEGLAGEHRAGGGAGAVAGQPAADVGRLKALACSWVDGAR